MSSASYNLFRGQLLGCNLPLSLKALSIAEDAHDGVLRKDGKTPYVEHPVKVASILYSLGIRDDVTLAAAILHDVIEDTIVDGVDIEQALNYISSFEMNKNNPDYDINTSVVVYIVKKVSKHKDYNNEEYYDVIKYNAKACLIKLADRVHNLSTLYNFTEDKKAKYLKETTDYVYPLIKYAQHHHPQYSDAFRVLDLWIESLVDNIKPYMGER